MEGRRYGGKAGWREGVMEGRRYGGEALWREGVMEARRYGGKALWREGVMEARRYGGKALWRIGPLCGSGGAFLGFGVELSRIYFNKAPFPGESGIV